MLLNYISIEQSVKIYVQLFTNCKSYGHLHDGRVSVSPAHTENHFATFCGGAVKCFVCSLFIRAIMR